MVKERRKKGILIGILCTLVVFMSIGFAAIGTQLNVGGNASVTDTWNIQITDITVKEASNGAENVVVPSYTSTTANFNVTLKEPGDYIIYTVTVANKGTLDATLAKITETVSVEGSDAIVYTMTPATGSEHGSTLINTNGIHTFDVKAEYLESAVGENAPEANASKTYSLALDYEQKISE